MRPLRYSINVTLDGCCQHEAGLPPDEESMRYWTAEMERADGLLFGRVTYEMMESAWRRPATGTWPDWMDEWQVPFAETIDRAKKYVVSSTLRGVDWNAELVRGDFGQAVQRLKQEPGDGLFVGGVTLPLALADLGLIDEYEFVVQPVLAGHGPTLLAGLRERIQLELVDRHEFRSGAVALRFRPRELRLDTEIRVHRDQSGLERLAQFEPSPLSRCHLGVEGGEVAPEPSHRFVVARSVDEVAVEPLAASGQCGELLVDLVEHPPQRRPRRAGSVGAGPRRSRLRRGNRPLRPAPLPRTEAAGDPPPRVLGVDDEHVSDGPFEKRPVVADDDDRSGPVLEHVFEHPQRVEVEVVRRLVQQQHVGTGPQRQHELQASTLAARQKADGGPLGVGVEPEALQEASVFPIGPACRAGHGLVDAHGRVEIDGALREGPDGDGRPGLPRPLVRMQQAGDDVEQRRLAGAVGSDDAEALARIE